MSTHHEKAQRYIGLLETARIGGNWHELPELIRKVTKHAPDRKCLIQTAKVEYAAASHASSFSQRPGTASSSQTSPENQIASLQTELRANGQPSEDVIQGQTALLWAYWVGLLKADPSSTMAFDPTRAAADASSLWTKICVVKAVYIQGMLLAQAGNDHQARDLHYTLLPWLDSNRSLVVSTPQLLYWAQQLLGRIGLGQRRPRESDLVAPNGDDTPAFRLQSFRHWAVLAVKNQDVSASTFGNAPGHVSKLAMWRAYYRFVSDILQQKRESSRTVSTTHPELATELRRVETSYESELLRNTQFPKATESNLLIEEWVEEFIRNWQILCGPDFAESDLGDGGRNSVGKNILDMLYRAATKTFHSTLILRRLFQVHKTLTEFDLAYKALDTYIELMDRARARATKEGVDTTMRDTDDIYMRTIAEGIEGLCSFGRKSEAEKAHDLCSKLKDLMEELLPPTDDSMPNHAQPVNGDGRVNGSVREPVSADLLGVVHRAIGIAKSQWARWTPFSENRSLLQSEAIESLQKAASQNVPTERQLKTLYALGRLLAETREVDEAISVVKKALACDLTAHQADSTYRLQRDLIPIWHLLALLLTSRQNFEIAGQGCAAAFEQFSPPGVIFGDSSNLAGAEEKQTNSTLHAGLVDDMECDELQRIIEIRITELALTELVEGPEHAVNNSNDLLALYSRLFGRYGALAVMEEKSRSRTRLAQPPKDSAGTVKSLRGSIFSRRKMGRSSESSRAPDTAGPPSVAADTTRPNTQTTQAPTIQVTDEDEKPSPHKHRLFRSSHEHSIDEKRRSSGHHATTGPIARFTRSQSRERKDPARTSDTPNSLDTTPEKPVAPLAVTQPRLQTIQSGEIPAVPASFTHDQSNEAKRPLKEVPHNLAPHDKMPPPLQHATQPLQQDVRLPIGGPRMSQLHPIPRFARAASQRYALSILVKIWLVIATLYRRAKLFDDSREACDEAAKVAVKIESLIASVESSARAFSDNGWGVGGKSSDELWADVYYERAELVMAIAREKEEKDGEMNSDGVRDAVEQYETCLMCYADHPGGIIGLSNVLLDYYERKVELVKKVDGGPVTTSEIPVERGRPQHTRTLSRSSDSGAVNGMLDLDGQATNTTNATAQSKDDDLKKTPENLNRLAARDRAYGLLSSLTKLGSAWDNAEAWFALARAHELGGEIDKAKEILWWCVELEDTRPIRHWSNIGNGGYVL
ncbi:hypothetical protein LTR10_014760 [Elasticomyces elasticus]|uniref:Filamentation protein (Rhf1) n=1 Tax=Exophiala sideris TaxID=1016849 RepID=A0ABR0J7G1_9EURO|nr:hypothetical protein LTR10_014760 [Elasticomyces elasticus]KAK5029405.1 hypothetical protein LTS07_005867 [Exophiala sideris]KAK5036897.1 hypothetical protein LTR13_005277 [Exophiala sideris]KAK5058035.1 hypothetical protein LTR69_007032 [Exophiala sideris]KAK5181994.1 hypothetical protein LTR44_005595 [Eurotiomycetes sp. CCFEE 6388]